MRNRATTSRNAIAKNKAVNIPKSNENIKVDRIFKPRKNKPKNGYKISERACPLYKNGDKGAVWSPKLS